MLDIKFIRENKDIVQEGARKKRINFSVDELLKTDDRRRELMTSIEKKRAEQNQWSDKIVRTPEAMAKAQLIAEMKMLKDELQKEEEEQKEVMKKWQALIVQVPNIPDMSVPEGESDADNQEVKSWGEIPKFSFTPKSHIEIMEKLGMIDLEKGAKISGFRGYFLKNDAVLLNFAIWQFVSDHFNFKGDFSQMMVPSLVRREALVGTGFLPQGEEDLYKTQDNDYLAGTAEVATMSYFADETFNANDLPKKIIAFSPSFRREAGSHGRDTKGIMRVHEFFKFEQVILCEASHEESVRRHEELLNNSEEIMQALKIPHHIVVNCTGDLGLGQVKKYDIEAWVPSENCYRETHSCSYFHDFQTRRLNIRYKDKSGKLQFAHSLNNTAIATPRILISIIENNQQEDGSIVVPEVLQKYMGKKIITERK